MRGGFLSILEHGVKGQGQLWNSVYKTLWARYRQFYSNRFRNSQVGCVWREEEPCWFWQGQISRSTAGGLYLWYLVDTIQATDFAQSLSNFKRNWLLFRRDTLFILGHRVKMSLTSLPPPLARGCHALVCLVDVMLICLKICYDKAGNLPNKGRNFNTQTWGKIVYFLFVYLVGIGFRQNFFRVLPNFGDFGAKNVIFSLYCDI